MLKKRYLFLLFLISNLGHSFIPKTLNLPTPIEIAEIAKVDTAKSLAILHNYNSDLLKDLNTRAKELIPKSAPIFTSYNGAIFQISAGSLIRIINKETKVIIDSSIIPAGANIVDFKISPDGKKIAYGFGYYGSWWQIWRIFDVEKDENDLATGDFVVKNLGNTPVNWMPDSKRIIYQKSTNINNDYVGSRKPQILLHVLGQKRNFDKVIFDGFESPETSHWLASAIDNDNVVIYRGQGSALIPMVLMLHNLNSGKTIHLVKPNKFLAGSPGHVLTGIKDRVIYLRTQELGDKFGIMGIDLKDPTLPRKFTVVKGSTRDVLAQSILIGDKLLSHYLLPDLSSEFRLNNLNGELVKSVSPTQLGLTKFGSVGVPFASGDDTSKFTYMSYSSVDLPNTTIKVDTVNNRIEQVKDVAQVPFSSSQIQMQTVNYASYDGAVIKMFIFYRKDLKEIPKFAYLFSYGFIGVSNLPQYNRKFQLALELGGIVAIPAIRGGGEFGANFQLEGTRDRFKTLKDLVYASRWLKNNKQILDKRVVISGRSFGGLSVASHYVNHQNEFDLFSSIVPITDVTRSLTKNHWWAADDHGIQRDEQSGKVANNAYQILFKEISNWSPMENLYKLANIKNLKPIIFFPAEHDVNTTPEQSVRFYDQLIGLYPNQPHYFVQHVGGHGARAELVDEMIFIAKHFNLNKLNPIK